MDRVTYLSQLETALRKKYREQQVQDILSDYEEFFATGIAEGKSEEELCAEFGPPEQAARELKDEGGENARSRNSTAAAVCTVLAVLVFAMVLWPFSGKLTVSTPQLISQQGPVNFWIVMLTPLILEGVLALWLRRGNSSMKKMKWVPRVHIILAVPLAASLAWLIYYSYKAITPEGIAWYYPIAAAWAANISVLILFVSIVLLFIYTMNGHAKAHWFLFCDTALLTLILNVICVLSSFGPEATASSIVTRIVSCLLWAILPNLAAAAVWWVIEKAILARRGKL
jgi:uncharacterized membrane protein